MDNIYWNHIIVFYLFAAGLSAGGFMVSAAAELLGVKYGATARAAAVISPFPLMAGVACLVFDLERPLSFWRLFVTFQPHSVMSIGAWLITGFMAIGILRAMRYADITDTHIAILRRVAAFSNKKIVAKAVLLLGIPLAAGTSVYTGVLLCTLSARPFWSTPALPLLFFSSAVMDGIAATRLVRSALHPTEKITLHEKTFLLVVETVSLFIFAFTVMLLLLGLTTSADGAAALRLIMQGRLAFPFWAGVVGIAIFVPLLHGAFELWQIRRAQFSADNPTFTYHLAAGLVLVGGYIVRYVVIYAGQMTHPALY
jgi:formate-dependent nitrite reductase membrane component NrfD